MVQEKVSEYWLQTPDPSVISIMKADNIGQIMGVFAGWDEFFEISVYPAITAEDGLELLKKMAPPQ